MFINDLRFKLLVKKNVCIIKTPNNKTPAADNQLHIQHYLMIKKWKNIIITYVNSELYVNMESPKHFVL
jgi:hypothetical protein